MVRERYELDVLVGWWRNQLLVHRRSDAMEGGKQWRNWSDFAGWDILSKWRNMIWLRGCRWSWWRCSTVDKLVINHMVWKSLRLSLSLALAGVFCLLDFIRDFDH